MISLFWFYVLVVVAVVSILCLGIVIIGKRRIINEQLIWITWAKSEMENMENMENKEMGVSSLVLFDELKTRNIELMFLFREFVASACKER